MEFVADMFATVPFNTKVLPAPMASLPAVNVSAPVTVSGVADKLKPPALFSSRLANVAFEIVFPLPVIVSFPDPDAV